MDQQPQVPQQPIQTPTEDAASLQRSNKLKLTWGLVCLVGPTAAIILSIVLYAVVNFVSGSISDPNSDEFFGSTGMGHALMNVSLFLIGALSVLAWLPGIIVGIILLATRK